MSSTNNTENKLRTFKLIDREGYTGYPSSNTNYTSYNKTMIEEHLVNDCFSGELDEYEDLMVDGKTAINSTEFKYFQEVFPKMSKPNTTVSSETPQSTQLTISPITMLVDFKILDSWLSLSKEGCTLHHEEDEYIIKNDEDYNNIINSLKLLQSYK